MSEEPVFIVCPCFNENETVVRFVRELETVVAPLPRSFRLVIVDDSSTDNTLELLKALLPQVPNVRINILSLRYNVGHQGAIYQGLIYCQRENAQQVIVMDADGEDDPSAIRKLITMTDYDIVHVVRGKRKENFIFRFSYMIYKSLFKLITNRVMNFGNYCMLSRRVLESVTATSFIHFAAHLSKLKTHASSIQIDRRKRIDGTSKMSLTGLIHHAFKSFVEYAEELLMIFLRLFVILFILFSLLILYIIYLKLFTDKAILGWASTLSIGLMNAGIITVGFFVIGVLLLHLSQHRTRNAQNEIYEVIDLPGK